VGVQLAARHPALVAGLFLIAAAGLPRRRGFWGSLRFWSRVMTFKVMKRVALILGRDVEALRARFASADDKNAGAMRPIFRSAIRENLTQQAALIQCPTVLVYGRGDTETPPEIGERYARLIPNATLYVLEGQDHYTVLGAGATLAQKRLQALMEQVSC
jgi:pimeloyl-ACP methyl ester carboxylesterase